MSESDLELHDIRCPACGLRFAIEEVVHALWFEEKRTHFFCPNGHSLSFKGHTKEASRIKELEAEAAKLHEKIANLETRLKAASEVIAREKKRADAAELDVELLRAERHRGAA